MPHPPQNICTNTRMQVALCSLQPQLPHGSCPLPSLTPVIGLRAEGVLRILDIVRVAALAEQHQLEACAAAPARCLLLLLGHRKVERECLATRVVAAGETEQLPAGP